MFEEIKELLIEEMSIDGTLVTREAEFIKDLGFNSLELADLVVICEDKYGVELDEDRSKTIFTVGDFVDYLEELTDNK